MTNKFKNFIIFNVNQIGAAKAMAEIDSATGAGSPVLYGNVCCIGFWTREYEENDQWPKEQIERSKKILEKNNIRYKYSTFNV